MKLFIRYLPYIASALSAGSFCVYAFLESICTIPDLPDLTLGLKETSFCKFGAFTQGAVSASAIVICASIGLIVLLAAAIELILRRGNAVRKMQWALSFIVGAGAIFVGRLLGAIFFGETPR